MGRHKRRHNQSFRDQACKLVTEHNYSVREAAKELGLPHNTLWNWLTDNGRRSLSSQEQDKQFADDPAAMRIRIKELEQRVQQLEMEKQILKKAAAFFAQENQP